MFDRTASERRHGHKGEPERPTKRPTGQSRGGVEERPGGRATRPETTGAGASPTTTEAETTDHGRQGGQSRHEQGGDAPNGRSAPAAQPPRPAETSDHHQQGRQARQQGTTTTRPSGPKPGPTGERPAGGGRAPDGTGPPWQGGRAPLKPLSTLRRCPFPRSIGSRAKWPFSVSLAGPGALFF